MSSISKAGIFIDVKDLLEYTDRMTKEMENVDRVVYGDELKHLNLAMIADFTMAYHRRDEHIMFTARKRGIYRLYLLADDSEPLSYGY